MKKKIIKRGHRGPRKGISDIVATILLVVIAVVGVSIIAGYLIPYVSKAPKEGGDCFSAREHLALAGKLGGIKTCWDSSTQETIVIVRRNPDDIEINGFAMSLAKAGESKRYDVVDGKDNPDVTTITYKNLHGAPYYGAGAPVENEQIVQKGSEYTYYINTGAFGPVTSAEVFPIIKSGDVCPTSDVIDVEPC